LVVRASQGHELYEVIPVQALENDFPRSLVQNYVHWIHRGTMAIEWRPLESKWTPSSDNWRLSTPEDPTASTLVLNSKCLVDSGSPTAVAIHRWLKPLEDPPNINIYYDVETDETEICLPRMNLDFILRKTGLESKQFRGMIVDTQQYLGTFLGLRNKLVLKDTQGTFHPLYVVVPPSRIFNRV